jgi:hypothetical protein
MGAAVTLVMASVVRALAVLEPSATAAALKMASEKKKSSPSDSDGTMAKSSGPRLHPPIDCFLDLGGMLNKSHACGFVVS